MDTSLDLESVETVFCFVVILLVGYHFQSRIFGSSKNLPPGPREWGTNWKLLKASWNGTLPTLVSEWAKKYGDVTFVYSLGQPIMFLNSTEVTRQLLTSDKYKFLVADRVQLAATRLSKLNGKDLIFSKYDAIMRKKRRMFYTALGQFGDGVDKFENLAWEEMERMFTEIDMSQGGDIDMTKVIARTLIVLLYILILGERPTDLMITNILERFDLAFNKLGRPDVDFVLDYLPFVTYLPGMIKNLVNEMLDAKETTDEQMYHDPKKNYIPGQPRGITDLVMDYQKKAGYEWLEKDEEHILAFIISLFLAAHLTNRSLLVGTFLCLLNYPKVTERITEEINKVIGDNRPNLAHKASMPYTEAVILEALRILSPVPLSGFRKSSTDIDFRGMFIPKNTLIFMNNWYYLHDEKTWEDPWSFKPERFLDNEGQLLPPDHKKRKDLIAFGVGIRACPGDVFSRSRTFMITTSILQRYELLPPANEKLVPANFEVPDENIRGIVRLCQPYKCRLIPRQTIKK